MKQYYIQSAFSMETEEKKEQEQRSLINIKDSFRKIIITDRNIHPHFTEKGILIIGMKDFLTSPGIIDY